ncbi:MAG TPA: DUF2254 family protein [Myxococcota bacterium]|nr:DUF2254 family protein [Myxococcota bacterium]
MPFIGSPPEPRVPTWRGVWLPLLSVLLGVSVALFAASAWLDRLLASGPLPSVWRVLVYPPNDAAIQTLSTAGQTVAAVLAIAITVVAIVVELAATRYTPRITEMFIRDPVTQAVMALFIVTTVLCLWVAWAYAEPEGGASPIPHAGFALVMLLLTVCLIVLLPYFVFVFTFLNPERVIDRIRAQTLEAVLAPGARTASERQAEAVRNIEQLTDVALTSLENRDKTIAMAAIDALQGIALDFQPARASLSHDWFEVSGPLARDPDFVAMSEGLLASVSQRKIWLELKVVKQFLTIFNEALNGSRDVDSLIGIRARGIAADALARGSLDLFDLMVRFFNSCLRAAINARDVRTAYYTVHQYGMMAEYALTNGAADRAVAISKYLRFYGHVSYGAELPFLLETVAYDLCTLDELAFECGSPFAEDIFQIFLKTDKEAEGSVQERSLRGVRKAQVRLATFFLLRGDRAHAYLIHEDMAGEPAEFLASIREELKREESPEYWEVTDREENFSWLPPERRSRLDEFFAWFDGGGT